jgi:hypothetical protein
MDFGGSSSSHPRQERGRGAGPDRRVRRGARNMAIGGTGRGAGEAKSRNKTWRREDAPPPQGEDQHAGVLAADGRGQPASSSASAFGTFASANGVPTPFGANGNGMNGFVRDDLVRV